MSISWSAGTTFSNNWGLDGKVASVAKNQQSPSIPWFTSQRLGPLLKSLGFFPSFLAILLGLIHSRLASRGLDWICPMEIIALGNSSSSKLSFSSSSLCKWKFVRKEHVIPFKNDELTAFWSQRSFASWDQQSQRVWNQFDPWLSSERYDWLWGYQVNEQKVWCGKECDTVIIEGGGWNKRKQIHDNRDMR